LHSPLPRPVLPPRRLWYYVAIWTALALAFSLQSLLYSAQTGRPWEPGAALLSSALYWYLWGILGVPVLWLADRFPIGGRHTRWHVALHAAAGAAAAAIHVLLRAAAEHPLLGQSEDGVRTFFVEQFHLDLLVYWGIVGASHAARFHRQAVARAAEAGSLAARAANLEAAVAKARLDALRAQLEPHFLFNTLQAVSTLMRQDVALADRTLAQLAALLRRVVDAADVQEVPLAEELDLERAYLEIQAVRFQARLVAETEVEPGLEHALVPILVMQPLIENACVHGIGRRPEGGRVVLRAERAAGAPARLRLTVSNDGPAAGGAAEPHAASAGREGVGLANTRRRLEALYREEQSLGMLPRLAGGVETVVEIPLRWSPARSAAMQGALEGAGG